MKTVTKQKYGYMDKMAEEMTYQSAFPTSVKCAMCGGSARLVILLDDDEGQVEAQRPRDYKGIWPHDCMAVANYMCGKCGEITTDWNQA